MVLRSGIILPFQFRDCKKLLMIGVPEENRDLSIWDLKNVVRAAFGIYNFEFRNKKIGFNIPDELLLQYLAQRHDLTNFVIEIGQGNDDMCMNLKEQLTYEPSCSQKLSIPLPQKSNESLTCDSAIMAATQMGQLYGNSPSSAMGVLTASMPLVTRNRSPPPPDCMENHSDHSSNLEPAHRMRSMCKPYNDNTPESLTQSMDPMDIIPKSEQDENELTENREMHYERRNNQQEIQHQMPQEAQSIHQQQLQAITQSQQSSQQQFIANYGHHQANLLSNTINNVTPSSPHIPPPPITPQLTHMSNQPAQTQYSPNMMNRFRRRGERMSKDQKELYVKFFEENPCMLTQRRNDIILEPLWNKLGSLLNSVPQGAVKNVEEWKQTFDAWRYRVFMYTRYNTKLAGAAAQNPKNYKPLTTTDQRAYAMWTSHKSVATQEFEKIEMFQNLDETQTDYDY